LRKAIFAILALSFLMGMASAAVHPPIKGAASANVTFDFEQSVQGSGYFMTYRYIQLDSPWSDQKGPMYKDYAHGSGTIDNEMTICAQDIAYIKPEGCYREYEAYSCISAREDNSMVYSPMTMAYGNGWYAKNPIRYDSLLKEKTEIKNYRPVTSMHHQVEYAKAVDKEIDVIVKDKYYEYEDPVYEGVGYTTMRINEDVTDGTVHIGVLQGEPNWMNGTGYGAPKRANGQGTSAWYNPMIEIDENYVGTFHIEKNMTLEVPYKHEWATKDWLSCCIMGGCSDMDECDRKYVCEECFVEENLPVAAAYEPTTSSTGCCG
jgi:hypothetical protein